MHERASGAGLWKLNQHERGAALLQQGEASDRLLVLTRGLAKLTYLSRSGDEWNKSFIVDQGLLGAIDGGISRFGAVAVEPCTIVGLPIAWAREAVGHVKQSRPISGSPPRPAHSAAGWSSASRRAKRPCCETAEVRYLDLLAAKPSLLARLPQGDIARHLRVTLIAFSRIKRRTGSTT